MQKNDAHNASTKSENDASTTKAGASVEDMRSAVARVEIKKKKNGLPMGVHREETTDSQGRDKRMTAKMQAFASNIVQGLSPNDAYRRAYDTANMSEASIVSEANKLLKDPRISLLLQSFWETLKENVIADHQATRRHIMAQLYDHAERTTERTSDRLKALELMGRAIGMFTDKVESKVEEVSVDQLKKELESSLELLSAPSMRSATH